MKAVKIMNLNFFSILFMLRKKYVWCQEMQTTKRVSCVNLIRKMSLAFIEGYEHKQNRNLLAAILYLLYTFIFFLTFIKIKSILLFGFQFHLLHRENMVYLLMSIQISFSHQFIQNEKLINVMKHSISKIDFILGRLLSRFK